LGFGVCESSFYVFYYICGVVCAITSVSHRLVHRHRLCVLCTGVFKTTAKQNSPQLLFFVIAFFIFLCAVLDFFSSHVCMSTCAHTLLCTYILAPSPMLAVCQLKDVRGAVRCRQRGQYIYMHTYIHTYIPTYIHLKVYTYIHTYIHIHI
jgi:hypothetical protein